MLAYDKSSTDTAKVDENSGDDASTTTQDTTEAATMSTSTGEHFMTQTEESQVDHSWAEKGRVNFLEFLGSNVGAIKSFLRAGYLSYKGVPHSKGHVDYIKSRDMNWVQWLKLMKSCGIRKWETEVVTIKNDLYSKYAASFLSDQEQHVLQLTALVDHCANEYLNCYNFPSDWVNEF